MDRPSPRLADPLDSAVLAEMLHDFNVEFETPSPGPAVLLPRLERLLTEPTTFAVVSGGPPVAFALVTLRTNVWFDGPVALLDELYVRPHLRDQGIGTAVMALVEAECRSRGVELIEINVDEADHDTQRFYERLGFEGYEPTTGDRAYYYSRELGIGSPTA